MKLLAASLAVTAALVAPLSAQWLNTPIKDVPRTADGKPDLTAPAPKAPDGHPDLSGVWMPNTAPLQDLSIAVEKGRVPYLPWAADLVRQRANGAQGTDDPAAYCVPGMPKLVYLPYPYKIFQLSGVTVILYEGFTTFRQIFTDGRDLPKNPQPSWIGYSIGKWDGDTFVVDTRDVNEKTWLDNVGRPHTDALHIIERYRRRNFGTMEVSVTFEDPKAYAEPWTVNLTPSRLILGQDLLEYVCTENNRDLPHMVGSGPK